MHLCCPPSQFMYICQKLRSMIRSMTGYGKQHQQVGSGKITVEIKSLNSKQLDLNLRLPADLKQLEFDLRNRISESVRRGKVDFYVTIEDSDLKKVGRIDREVAAAAFEQLNEMAYALRIQLPQDMASLLLKFPGVIANGDGDVMLPESLSKALTSTALSVLNEFDAFRMQEGQALKLDILSHINLIISLLDEVTPFENQRTELLKNRLMKNVSEVSDHLKFDPNRFEQELIYYLEKLDISEEKVRLRQHCNYFMEAIDEDYAGKKLGFIVQEIGREINTLGSKANDAQIQRIVVQMKDELEKIKEQLFNVL
ncbi:MAG: hypothetical protein FD155_625 [Bacteroidetes bacterium]|nr:MAG: hypothetical protein FD155_625 [Bacteroidota bacterium]